jgi:hypothetical protein
MPDTPILAPATGAPEQAIRFIRVRPHGAYDAASIARIVGAYWATGTAAGVDPAPKMPVPMLMIHLRTVIW